MEEPAALETVANSKIAEKIYDDGASSAVRELGGVATDLIKTLRLFTAPFQLAAAAQDRFSVWLEQARSRVPPEMQTEAPPTVSGPALRAMLFMEQDNPMAALFVNLLTQAINKETQSKVHPGFITILEQINPDEAMLLRKVQQKAFLGTQLRHHSPSGRLESLTTFENDDFIDPDSIYMYLEYLERLGLVRLSTDVTMTPPPDHPEWANYRWYCLTVFGSRFLEVCGQS